MWIGASLLLLNCLFLGSFKKKHKLHLSTHHCSFFFKYKQRSLDRTVTSCSWLAPAKHSLPVKKSLKWTQCPAERWRETKRQFVWASEQYKGNLIYCFSELDKVKERDWKTLAHKTKTICKVNFPTRGLWEPEKVTTHSGSLGSKAAMKTCRYSVLSEIYRRANINIQVLGRTLQSKFMQPLEILHR